MKQKVLPLVFLAAFSIQSFAQEETANAVFIDLSSTIIGVTSGGFGIGAGYERALNNYFSVLGNFSVIGFEVNGGEYLGIGVIVYGRTYPFSGGTAVREFFISIGGGYSYIDIKYNGEEDVSNIVEAKILVGWKFVFGHPNGIFLEPAAGIGFVFADKVNTPPGMGTVPLSNKIQYGVSLGYAF
ncbi:MAG: hypothetical protein LBC27_02600 [Spirochaetaceae bacterium]|nr:hypothetical protein [Spirochaetaceae bacterium]